MLESLIEMVRQKRPRGPMWPVDEEWKRAVLRRMKDKGISRADLARELSVSGAAITVLFREETKQSRLVPAMHRILGMVETTAPAVAIAKDDALRRLQKIWSDLSEAQREHLATTGEMLAVKR